MKLRWWINSRLANVSGRLLTKGHRRSALVVRRLAILLLGEGEL